ncbi:MAG: iron ABC transporter permease [Anaerolineae bacterium]|nr:iron ABC transporter permease [Anaerolineae bacterium]
MLALVIAGLVLLPIGQLVTGLLDPDWTRWGQLWATRLPTLLENTLLLVAGVGVGTFLLGTSYAWLVTAYDFPGRRVFEHALLLPLAVPSFVMGFVYLATFDFAGPVQRQWRAWFGSEVAFPNIQSTGGVVLVMTLVLYPYVYILARAAFQEQAASTFEAARVMGYSRLQTFLRLVLPLARPSLAAGTSLAMMEALTDYGTVSIFSYPTLTEQVVIEWEGRWDGDFAVEFASMLLLFALGMVVLERALRGRAKYYQAGGSRGRHPSRKHLRGGQRWLATLLCLALLSVAFILPTAQLTSWAISEMQAPSVGDWDTAVYTEYMTNSVRLAGYAAGIVVVLALLVAHGARATSIGGQRPLVRGIVRLVTLGYALPGAVIALGVLLLVTPIDHQVTDFLETHLGRQERSLIFTGTMTGLLYAYIVRFMAVGYSSIDASLEKIKPSMEEAARTLGARPWRVLWRIHTPLVSTGLAAGSILIFVDVMKELPATLLLRPFGMDTLALWSYFLARESFWEAAALPALSILVVGLLPVFVLMRLGGRGLS